MVDVDEWVGVLLSHHQELVFESRVVFACYKTNVTQRANFSRALPAPILVALQEVAELHVV